MGGSLDGSGETRGRVMHAPLENPTLEGYSFPLDGILAVQIANFDTYHRELDLDCIWLSDDYGTQQNLIMSPSLRREFIQPRVKLLYDAVHDRGYHFALHSDGAISAVIPDIVDIGVDIVNPIQSECVDVGWVKREYGGCLTIWGGYGIQRTLAFGTPDQVYGMKFMHCAMSWAPKEGSSSHPDFLSRMMFLLKMLQHS